MKLSLLLIAVLCIVNLSWAKASTTKPAPHHIAKHVVEAHGHSKVGDNKDDHKHIKKSGKEAKHTQEAAHKGNHGAISHKITDEEKALRKTSSHSEGAHQTHKKSGAHQDHSAKFAEGAKHKKTGYTKGFHEQYHKNEHKKHDTFYNHGKKSGDWKTFAGKKAKHASHKFDKVEHKNKLGVKSLDQHGRAGKKVSGHKIDDHKFHNLEKGKKTTHYDKQQKLAKKHQKPEDKQKYKYSQIH